MYLLFPATKNLLKCRKLITCSHIHTHTFLFTCLYLNSRKTFFLLRRFMKYTRCINMIKYSNIPCYVYLNPHEMWLNNKKWIHEEEKILHLRIHTGELIVCISLHYILIMKLLYCELRPCLFLPNTTSNTIILQKTIVLNLQLSNCPQ